MSPVEKSPNQQRRIDHFKRLPPLQLIRELSASNESFNREEFIDPRRIRIENIVDDNRAKLLGNLVLQDIKKGVQQGVENGFQP